MIPLMMIGKKKEKKRKDICKTKCDFSYFKKIIIDFFFSVFSIFILYIYNNNTYHTCCNC